MNRKSFLKTLSLVAASPTLIREVVEEPVKSTILSIPNGGGGQMLMSDNAGKISWQKRVIDNEKWIIGKQEIDNKKCFTYGEGFVWVEVNGEKIKLPIVTL